MGGIMKSVGGALGFGSSMGGVNGAAGMSEDEAFRQLQILKAQEANQRAFGDQLYNQAAGKAPSFAEAQMRASHDRNLAQQMAMAKSNRSANAGLQSRNVQMNAAAQAQQTNQNAAMARLQEQQQNQAQYSNYLNGLQNSAQGMLGVNAEAQKNAFKANSENDAAKMKGVVDVFGAMGGGAAYMKDMFKSKDGLQSTGMGPQAGGPNAMDLASMATMVAYKGAKVPGEPVVAGDSPLNDTVTAKVSPGEVIVPRTIVQKGPDAVSKFVQALEEKTKKSEPVSGFSAVLEAQKNMERRISEIESKYGKKR